MKPTFCHAGTYSSTTSIANPQTTACQTCDPGELCLDGAIDAKYFTVTEYDTIAKKAAADAAAA